MGRISRFNNAGIELLRLGRYEIAHDLLRASLEAKLAQDRQEVERQQNPRQVVGARSVSPEVVSIGEQHLANLQMYLGTNTTSSASTTTATTASSTTSSSSSSTRQATTSRQSSSMSSSSSDEETTSPLPQQHETDHQRIVSNTEQGEPPPQQERLLYLHKEGFMMMEDETQSSVQLRSSINVFNLGLVHQLRNAREEKARDFYRVAVILLSMAPSAGSRHATLMQLALTNNFGVWCYENEDYAQARTCMQQMAALLELCQAQVSNEVRQGLIANLVIFGIRFPRV